MKPPFRKKHPMLAPVHFLKTSGPDGSAQTLKVKVPQIQKSRELLPPSGP